MRLLDYLLLLSCEVVRIVDASPVVCLCCSGLLNASHHPCNTRQGRHCALPLFLRSLSLFIHLLLHKDDERGKSRLCSLRQSNAPTGHTRPLEVRNRRDAIRRADSRKDYDKCLSAMITCARYIRAQERSLSGAMRAFLPSSVRPGCVLTACFREPSSIRMSAFCRLSH